MYFRKMLVRFILITFMVAPFVLLTQGTCPGEVPKKGGTYTVAIESKISNLDPQYSGGPNQRIWATFYENLITKDIEGNIQPALATDWEWVDKRHLKFTLRKGVKFTTGRKLDADAVVASFERALNPQDPHQFFGFTKWIKGVQKEDDYTIIIETDRDYPMATDYLCSTESGVIVDAKAAEECSPLTNGYRVSMLGSRGTKATGVKNPILTT
jgi:ABC-type transport system substrate-binding protein